MIENNRDENNMRNSEVKIKLSPSGINQLHLKPLSFLLHFSHTGLPWVFEYSSYTVLSYDALSEKLLSVS